MATSVAASTRLTSEVRERRTAAAPDSTPARIHHHSVGYIYIAAGAAWEADVWGRIRSKKAAAKAESAALEADYEFARQSLAAAVARVYISTIEAAQQEANAQETLDIYQEYVKAHGMYANSKASRVTSTSRKSSRAPPPPKMRSTPHRRRGRRRSARSRS